VSELGERMRRDDLVHPICDFDRPRKISISPVSGY
jgi:hypothetical protein